MRQQTKYKRTIVDLAPQDEQTIDLIRKNNPAIRSNSAAISFALSFYAQAQLAVVKGNKR